MFLIWFIIVWKIISVFHYLTTGSCNRYWSVIRRSTMVSTMVTFLKTAIFAISKSNGNFSVFSDCLKIISNIGAISVEQLFNIPS